MRRVAVAGLMLACGTAFAQAPAPASNPNVQAQELAKRLGRERSVEGLATIAASRNTDLMRFYESGWREATAGKKPEPLPPEVEALVIKHYADPVMGPAMRSLYTANWTPFRTRELFDLLFAEWRSGKVRPGTYAIRDAVLKTPLAGIEAPLLEWLQARDAPTAREDLAQIAYFLGQRQYRPAVATLAAMQRHADRAVANAASMGLLGIQSPEAIDAVLERMTAMRGDNVSEADRKERAFLAGRVAALPATVPLPYERLRAALPDNTPGHSLTWLTARKDLAAVPDALVVLADTTQYPRPLEALVASDSPQVWKQARAEIERLKGKLNDGQYRYASAMLDDKIANPGKHFAEQRRTARQKEFDARKGEVHARRNDLLAIRATEPDRWLEAYEKDLRALEAIAAEYDDLGHAAGLRDEIASEYLKLGHHVRFRMKRPARALALYERSAKGGHGSTLGDLGMADTLEHDLRDKPRALAEYKRMQVASRSAKAAAGFHAPGSNPAEWVTRWLGYQVDHLSSGRRFGGRLGRDDYGVVLLVMYYGGGNTGPDEVADLTALGAALRPGEVRSPATPAARAQVARVLEPLPSSAFTLLRTASYVAMLPDARSILAYLERQDPAGYASACILAIAELAKEEDDLGRQLRLMPGLAAAPGTPSPMEEARIRFYRDRRISVGR